LPLHFGGEGESVRSARLEVQVGVTFGHDDLVAEDLRDVLQFLLGLRRVVAVGEADGEDADTVPADADREVGDHLGGACGPLHVRALGPEGASRSAGVHGYGLSGVREGVDGLQYGHRVIGQEQVDGGGCVVGDERVPHRFEEGVGRSSAQRALHSRESVHRSITTCSRMNEQKERMASYVSETDKAVAKCHS
jgi:hypothetical protein